MFLIMISYKKPIEIVEQYTVAHRAFLSECYEKDYFVVSGPRNPRTGGILISQLKERQQVEDVIKSDPFFVNEIADYEIIEFIPVKYHKNFLSFVE